MPATASNPEAAQAATLLSRLPHPMVRTEFSANIDWLRYQINRLADELHHRRNGTNHPTFYSAEWSISELEQAVTALAVALAVALHDKYPVPTKKGSK